MIKRAFSIMTLTVMLLVLMTATTSYCQQPAGPTDKTTSNIFIRFKKDFVRNYKDRNTEVRRCDILLGNNNGVDEHNKRFANGVASYRKGLNQYADMTPQEFMRNFTGLRMTGNRRIQPTKLTTLKPVLRLQSPVILPQRIDWREKNYVTSVKNQNFCGACWAFSATACLESQNLKKYGKQIPLSEQNLVDCVLLNFGCEGGDMDTAFDEIRARGGINSAAAYPYEASTSTCRYNKSKSILSVKGYIDIEPGNEEKLKEAVASVGPICVGVDATNFHLYSNGIFTDTTCSPENLNHAMALIGYDTDRYGSDYWILKNSWGTTWGMSGYMFLARNANNMCGIATMASYPVV